MYDHLKLNGRVAALIDQVHVAPGGLKAETAGEVYEADTYQALSRKLATTLYQTLHTGRDKPLDASMRTWREPAFDAALDEATGPRTSPVSGRVLATGEDHLVVDLDGLRVRVPSSAATLQSPDRAEVRVPSARPALSPGFFLATSSVPQTTHGSTTLRLYAHLDNPDAAPEVWRTLVALLEDARIPWRAKISSSRLLYPRNDAVVVYLPRPGWRKARAIAQSLQDTGLLAAGTSPFTRPITDSVSCAFEPDDQRPSRQELSFGQHRTQVFAEALVKHAALPHAEQESVQELIVTAFIDAGIDPSEPARNLSSPVVDVLQTF
ncbi:hypothetical protein JQK87_04625 [Streptomyces sp. G44]|uniref:T3SS effector HopA1 family protein n=1 Tax=Streptomyces sp. G44 TaxID=2807632 RepID=UPI0019611B35|nr:T3SS effector HopA1 family protein [Streptomyces sp. G44]MBM7167702.1 hypothetical protein [Streptomyces sp. G44]